MDMGRFLHALFSPQTAYGQTATPAAPRVVAPATRAGNAYQGQALPVGVSSLLASSEDSRGKRAPIQKTGDDDLGGPSAKRLDKKASQLIGNLFGTFPVAQAANPDLQLRMPTDRWADRMLDRTGYFDPRGGSIADRNRRAIDEWLRHVGLPPQDWSRTNRDGSQR